MALIVERLLERKTRRMLRCCADCFIGYEVSENKISDVKYKIRRPIFIVQSHVQDRLKFILRYSIANKTSRTASENQLETILSIILNIRFVTTNIAHKNNNISLSMLNEKESN